MDIKCYDKWDDMNLPNMDVLRGIYAYGFENPSPIQSKSIVPILNGHDVIAQAQSGTGKTGAFTVAALSILKKVNETQVMILVPTHELAHQISKVLEALSYKMDWVKVKTILGGSSIESDIRTMKQNVPHILVGCPGRMLDMIKRRQLVVSTIKLFVLDEADEMLSSGFKTQVFDIYAYLNADVQVALFSATMDYNMNSVAEQLSTNPIKISVEKESLTLEGIKQYYVAIQNNYEKYEVLKDIYSKISMSQCIVYANTVYRAEHLKEAMFCENFPVCCIHGNMPKEQRESIFNGFLKGEFRVLISTDLTSRGIDIQQVAVVINFDVPKSVHTYLHRIGRSGRWGRKGTGINFVTKYDVHMVRSIEKYYDTQIDELPENFVI